ncbi:MAG: molybdopterin-dependent oxidoreductase [Proteobacteria bacterium]|nr:molybdopterin-dependent oxidoreductase [Pseudomonadota bacterium]
MPDTNDLPLTATHWGTYGVETHNGIVRALHGFSEDPDVSPIGHGIVDSLDAPSRIHAPMVRESWLNNGPGSNTAGRGVEAFVEVSWESAERLVASELDRVRAQFGNQAIFAGSYGWASAGRFHHAQSQLHRFMNCLGGYTSSVNTYSFAAAEVVVPHILGSFRYYLETITAWTSIIKHTKLVVAFGGVPLKNGQINSGGVGSHGQRESIAAARAAGVDFIVISPLKSDMMTEAEAEWIAPRPTTDTALLLGIAHTLLDESLHDIAFLERYCVGFEKFVRYLRGTDDGIVKTADWAAQICAIDAQQIQQLARRMAAERTMISVSWSLTRQDHGEQPFWAAITVAAMLGQIGLPGGGIGFGYSAVNSIGSNVSSIPVKALPQGSNPIDSFIPVARISDMLLHPGAAFDYNGKQYTYPEIQLIYWAGGNPFHHHQDLNRMVEAWRRPATIIAHEWCWNAQAKFADIVLPCTTPLERTDVALSPRDPYWIFMEQAIAPHAQARDDFDIFRAIARHLNVEEEFTGGREKADWLRWIYAQACAASTARGHAPPDFDTLRAQRWFKHDEPQEAAVMLADFRRDPVKCALKTPSGKIEIYSETVAQFGYADCPGHASWLEPIEWLGNSNGIHDLHLISNQPKTKLHSQLDQGAHSRAHKIQQREPVTMHPDDASKRGIAAGDVVRLFNSRGACLAGVRIDAGVRQGVVQLSTGAWFDPAQSTRAGHLCKHGNPNVLTIDKGTSRLAQGPIAHSCLVAIARYDGELPPLTAFDPPPTVVQHSDGE